MSQARATPEMRKAFLDAWVPGEVRGDPELAQILNDAFDRAYAAMMEGYAVVPIHPTYQMCQAGGFVWEEAFPTRYAAMLNVATDCETCSGAGEVLYAADTRGFETVTCPECNGSGSRR